MPKSLQCDAIIINLYIKLWKNKNISHVANIWIQNFKNTLFKI